MMPTLKLSRVSPSVSARMVKKHKAPDPQSIRSLPKSTAGFLTRGRFVGKTGGSAQRVSAHINYKKAAFANPAGYRQSLRANAAYITRDGTLEAIDEKGQRLTLDEVNDKTHGWDDDPRYYKVILSPEYGHRMNLDEFATRTMEKVREDVLIEDELRRNVPVEWISVQHHDTDHPHVHIMMRAKVEDRELRLSAGYVSHGFKNRAQEVATGMLGYRVERAVSLEASRGSELVRRREELGLDPTTGRAPTTDATDDTAASSSKNKDLSRDKRGFDGGIG